MTYALKAGRVTLQMSRGDYDHLLVILGFAAGAASQHSRPLAREILRFANELNRANPEFTPYQIVDEPSGAVS